MILRVTLIFVVSLSLIGLGKSQSKVVVDKSTGEPISDVFVFIDNSSIGTSTNIEGAYELEVNYELDQSLVYSHINYELLKVKVNRNYLNIDTLQLIPFTNIINEVSVIEKVNPRIRNRRLQRFKETFLGYNINSKLIRITNPETLLFQKENNKLNVSATEPVLVENRQLGYNVKFYLDKFTLQENDDLFLKGSVFFEEIKGKRKDNAKFKRNRKKLFDKSQRKFFIELASNIIPNNEKYQVGFASLNINREFVHYTPVILDSLSIEKINDDLFSLNIKRYIAITVKDIVLSSGYKSGLSPNFSTGLKSIDNNNINFATSYLKSKSNKILFDAKGRIINPLEIEEYGYWAELRVGDMLPLNYSNN